MPLSSSAYLVPRAARYALVCATLLLLLPGASRAEPLTITAGQAARPPRADSGTGLCANAIHVKDPSGVLTPPFQSLDQAAALVSQKKGDGPIDDKVRFIAPGVNFRNADVGSIGDFSGMATPKAYFPFSASGMATPPNNDRNFALRLRGYLNVPRPTLLTIALNGDDAARLLVAGALVGETQEQVSSRVARQVRFEAAGLYPVEVMYYQNASVAVLELSRAEGGFEEGRPNKLDISRYALFGQTELFSARIGRGECIECDNTNPCARATYCGDGLCQACNTADHCGESCEVCGPLRPYCTADRAGALRCVECTSDAHCPSSLFCDRDSGTCITAPRCKMDSDCPPGSICDPKTGTCATPVVPCTSDESCPGGQICTKGTCTAALPMCDRDHVCPPNYACDPDNICRPQHTKRYVGGCSLVGAGASGAGPSGPGGSFGLFGLGLIGALGLLLRRRQRAARAAVFFSLTLLVTGSAQAQISLNAQTFRPALGPENIITVEGSRTPGRVAPILGILFEYGHRPLRFVDANSGDNLADTVPGMTTLHLLGGVGVTRWLALSADLPIVIHQSFDSRTPSTDVREAPASAGLGDLRLVGKLRMIDNSTSGFGMAFVPEFTFPTGKGEAFRGEDAFDIVPRLAVDYRSRGGVILALNAGFLIRTSDQVARNVRVSHQARYGLGLYVPLPAGFGLAGEIVGGTSVSNPPDGTIYSPLEMYGAPRWTHKNGWGVQVGAGGGLLTMAGSPQFRVFGGVSYQPFGRKPQGDPDRDHDGVVNEKDRCPDVPGPIENFGCPDGDRDKDGVIDRLDRCPDQAGPLENGGCPDGDRDKDGIIDRLDRCPDRAGPADNHGCPEIDTDKDGIPDRLDNCPNEAGPKDNGGCPVRKYITVTAGKIELKQKILFATNKSVIRPASFDLLNEVVSVLRNQPNMEVRIEGHTDSRGKPAYNLQLSEARAGAVRNYLIAAGIDETRLVAIGHGMTRPIADNATKSGREMNRRTEFYIVKR